jgi:hypothetical protein
VSARRLAYPAPGYAVRIPRALWRGALDTMRLYGRLESEGLVYLAGVVVGPDQLAATSLYRLHHKPQGHRVEVTPKESRTLLRTLRHRDEKLVAQLHSHGGVAWHSAGDDAHATSFHAGFLSVVVPDFGEGVLDIGDCAVFEFDGERFRPLDHAEVARRTVVYDEILEFSPSPVVPRKEGLWARFARRLRPTAASAR